MVKGNNAIMCLVLSLDFKPSNINYLFLFMKNLRLVVLSEVILE